MCVVHCKDIFPGVRNLNLTIPFSNQLVTVVHSIMHSEMLPKDLWCFVLEYLTSGEKRAWLFTDVFPCVYHIWNMIDTHTPVAHCNLFILYGVY